MSLKTKLISTIKENGLTIESYLINDTSGLTLHVVNKNNTGFGRSFRANVLFTTPYFDEAKDFASDIDSLVEREFYIMDDTKEDNFIKCKGWFFKDKQYLSFGKNEHLRGKLIKFEDPKNAGETGWITFR